MGLRVEDVLVETEQLRVVGEEQVEVLQRLAQEETLHLVPGTRVNGVAHVVDGSVAAAGDLKRRRSRVRDTMTQAPCEPGQRSNVCFRLIITGSLFL